MKVKEKKTNTETKLASWITQEVEKEKKTNEKKKLAQHIWTHKESKKIK